MFGDGDQISKQDIAKMLNKNLADMSDDDIIDAFEEMHGIEIYYIGDDTFAFAQDDVSLENVDWDSQDDIWGDGDTSYDTV